MHTIETAQRREARSEGVTYRDGVKRVSSVEAVQVTQTELARRSTRHEHMTQWYVDHWAEERRQQIGPLRVADEDLDVVDTTTTQRTDIDAWIPTFDDELSAFADQWRCNVRSY